VFVTETQGAEAVRLGLARIEADGAIEQILSGPQVPSHPSFDVDAQRVVYQSTLQSQTEGAGLQGLATIDSIPLDGGQRATVIEARGAAYQPAVAPEGSEIAAVIGDLSCIGKDCPQQLRLYRDGVESKVLVESGAAAAPAWSPDGKRIAFVWDRDGSMAVWTVDVATGEVAQVSRGPDDSEPAWSPDGTEVVFSRDCDLFVQAVNGGEARQITDTRRCEISPTWRWK
jgi:Tol biopolymer transport system component